VVFLVSSAWLFGYFASVIGARVRFVGARLIAVACY
jgi:hypothetical protein